MRLIFVILSFTLFNPLASANVCDLPDNKLISQIQSRKNKISIGQSLSIGEYVKLRGDTEIVIRPTLDQKHFLRGEKLGFSVGAGIGEGLTPNTSVAIGGSIAGTAELIRQYDTFCDTINAFKNPPIVSLEDIPYNSRRALNDLRTQDYFRFQTRLGFTISASALAASGITILGTAAGGHVHAGATYVLYGDFQIEVFKLDNNRVFVRASSLRQKTWAFGAGLSINPTYSFDLFQVEIVDDAIKDLIPVPSASIRVFEHTTGSLFAMEYVYNLKNDIAKNAYDQLVNPAHWKAEHLNLFNPRYSGQQEEIQTVIQSIVEPSVVASQNHPEAVRLLTRTQSHFDESGGGLRLDLLLFSIDFDTGLLEQYFAVNRDPVHNNFERYRVATFHEVSASGTILSLFESNTRREANAIFSVNADDQIVDFHELSFVHEFVTNRLAKRGLIGRSLGIDTGDTKPIQQMLNRVFPDSMRRTLPTNVAQPGVLFKGILDSYAGYSARFTMDVRIRKEALSLISRVLTEREIKDVIDTWGHNLPYQTDIYGQLIRSPSEQSVRNVEKTNTLISEIIKTLPKTFKTKGSPADFEKQWSSLLGLKSNDLFKIIMPGVFMRLIERAAAKDQANNDGPSMSHYFSAKFTIAGKARESQTHILGQYERPQDLDIIVRLRNRITQRAYDPEFFVTAGE